VVIRRKYNLKAVPKSNGEFDFWRRFLKIQDEGFVMKDFFKTLVAIIGLVTAFVVGFNIGKEKERRKIPKFQED
jgi:hypothetical protein